MQLSPTAAPQKEVLTPPLGEVSATAKRVYVVIGDHCLDEPECWPSQKRIAKDAGLSLRTVVSAIKELREAGWLTISKRWTWRDESGRRVFAPDDTTGLVRSFQHNVYELMADFVAHEEAVRERVRAAHRRADLKRLRTNYSVGEKTPPGGWCRCRSCRPDRTPKKCRPPQHPWSLEGAAIRAAIRESEEIYGRELTPDEKQLKKRLVHLQFEMRQMDFDREFPPARPSGWMA